MVHWIKVVLCLDIEFSIDCIAQQGRVFWNLQRKTKQCMTSVFVPIRRWLQTTQSIDTARRHQETERWQQITKPTIKSIQIDDDGNDGTVMMG